MGRSLAVVVAVLGLAAGAAAEIYRCQGSDGEVRFTSDPSQCPNAQPHELQEGTVQRVEKTQEPLVSARPGARGTTRQPLAAPSESGEGSEAVWREKKLDAQRKLAQANAALETFTRVANWCNRGHAIWTEDSKTGMRREIECEDVDAEQAKLEARKRELEHYLAEGLEEECRRAGCLPGWLR